ncbi:MAG: carboxypeptidase-like regulatory domain-containing protein, partial [Planctomycetota bacterium]
VALVRDGQAIQGQGADARGGLSLRWLAPGEYQLVITNERYLEWTGSVTVTAGESTRLDVEMVSFGRLGTISGALRSRTGRHRSKGGILTLTSKDHPDFALLKTARYRKRSGDYEAAFSFEDVPVGRYELRLDPLDNRRWSALTLEVSAPATGVDFWCEDEAATFELAFRVLAARTDAPLESPWTIVWMGDPAADRRLDTNWESGTYLGVPEGVPMRWLVSAPDCRPVWGDETAFTSEGATRVAEVRLEPGWGQRFVVTHGGKEPLPGVEVRIDGESAGRTDSNGVLFVERDAKPATLEFVLEGWHVTWGYVDPSHPGFKHLGLESPVYLKRDE